MRVGMLTVLLALAVRPSVSKSWTEYTQAPGEIVRARAEVDALIGEMLPTQSK